MCHIVEVYTTTLYQHYQLCFFSEVMDEVSETVPILDKIVAEIEGLAESGGNYTEAPHVIEVTLPMLCR